MKFIEEEYLKRITEQEFPRAKDDCFIHYSKIDLFNEAKEIMLLSKVSKPTWYSLMNKIQSKSINSSEQFTTTTRPLNLIEMVHEIFMETGEVIDIEDVRNILYAYEDYCLEHPEHAVREHFAIQEFVRDLYKIKANQYLLEVLCLSDFVILKMCPEELMNAQIVTLETCIKIAKQQEDYEMIIAFADFGLSLLVKDTFTYKYCENAKKRFAKFLNK